MSEARRRTQLYEAAKQNLLTSNSGDALIVAKTAVALFEHFILPKRYTGGCYLTTMILHRFLADERGILVKPIVGFVNDGTDNIMISHAWLEYEGRKVDLTLHLTDHPDVQRPGALLVLDHVLRPGRIAYSYHLVRTPEGLLDLKRMRKDPRLAPVVEHKEAEHLAMMACVENPSSMLSYINGAPPELGYAAMTAALR